MSHKDEIGTDPVIEFLEKLKAFIEKNKNSIISIGVAVAVIVFGFSLYQFSSEKKLSSARVAYGEAILLSQKNETKKTEIALLNIIENFSNTPFAYYAYYTLGHMKLEVEKYKEAEEFFVSASEAGDDVTFVRAEALEAIAICREATGDNEGAMEFYKKVLSDKYALYRHPSVRWKAALLAKKLGDNSQSIKFCKDIVSDTLAIPYTQKAKSLIATINSL